MVTDIDPESDRSGEGVGGRKDGAGKPRRAVLGSRTAARIGGEREEKIVFLTLYK
jgi:hypothetical protein